MMNKIAYDMDNIKLFYALAAVFVVGCGIV